MEELYRVRKVRPLSDDQQRKRLRVSVCRAIDNRRRRLSRRSETGTHLTVLRSLAPDVSFSTRARFRTLRNSVTRARMRECMYALEHLMW